jgi:hypothetical protein
VSQPPPVGNVPLVVARAVPAMTWNGALVGASETVTHYLHLSAFPCEKCHGPVIAGSLGTRRDEISQETDIREIGAACIACGFVPETLAEPSVDHRFRPVEWKWAIKPHIQTRQESSSPKRFSPVDSTDDQLSKELSQDADTDSNS